MASGPMIGGANDSAQKNRWADTIKVYTRRIHKTGNNSSHEKTAPQQSSETLVNEDRISDQQQSPTLSDAALDNSSSLKSRSPVTSNVHGLPIFVNESPKPVFSRVENKVKIHLANGLKEDEIREVRQKLLSELDLVRIFAKKVEEKEIQISGLSLYNGYSYSQLSADDVLDEGGAKRVNSEAGSVNLHDSRPFGGNFLEKEKRTIKVNQFYQNSDFVLGNEKLPPLDNNKKLKSKGRKKNQGELEYGFGMNKFLIKAFKNCSDLLSKLMKHKYGWVFNSPVDVKGLCLYDYYTLIKQPMDLGTVRSRLNKLWYRSPREFAEDVRLTFRNAMTYNPEGHDVHVMATELLKIFEEKWAVIDLDWRSQMIQEMGKIVDRSESMATPRDSSRFQPAKRTPALKKPKANEPNKRDMTYEEKQKLSSNLQCLPLERLDNIVEIIKRRSSALNQHDDEIEVDIDNVDAETLWELDRFVTNYKKNLSKKKRKAEMALQKAANQKTNLLQTVSVAPGETKTDGKTVPSSIVQGDNKVINTSGSSSSSSSTSDSSSSDSDSDTSSSDESNEEHSPKTT